MVHWSQAVRLGPLPPLVRRFDFGTRCEDPASGMPLRCNQLAYNGSEVPPAYDLSRVAGVPLALFTGGQDRLATPLDVEYLLESLPPGAVVYRHDEPDYEHIDFTWGANAAERIYGRLLQLLAQY